MAITYRMYVTDDPEIAVRAYQETTGYPPRMVLARPEADLKSDHPLLIRNRTAPFGALLVTHEADSPEFGEAQRSAITWIPPVGPIPKDDKPLVRGRGRPKNDCRCPMCDAPIIDFNKLGYWWGWQYGIVPPYWDDLREYVLARDGHHCTGCGRPITFVQATVHHIIHKEDGGIDSARNLTSLCAQCHIDTRPMMPSDDNDA